MTTESATMLFPDPKASAVQHASSRLRIESVDLLRGIIIVIMALDHVRDFFGALDASPTNLAATTAPLFYLIHLLAVAACYVRFGSVGGMFQSPDLGHFPFTAPPGWAAGLPAIYLVWALVVLILYPLCRWYAGVKRRRKDWWLSYL